MSMNNDKLVQSGLFGNNPNQSDDSIVNDRRTAPVLTNISTCVAVGVTEPKPYFPIVGFEKNSNGKNAPLFSEKSIGYEVFVSVSQSKRSLQV